jgi:hypothetical protein
MTQPHIKTKIGAPPGQKLSNECGCDRCGQKRRPQWVGKKHSCCGGLFRVIAQVMAKSSEVDGGIAQHHDNSLTPEKLADSGSVRVKGC